MAENKREVINHKVVDGEPTEIYVGKPRNVGDLTVKLDLDASDAIKALKAVQREAREATKALRELEAAQVPEHIKNYDKSLGWSTDAGGHAWFESGVHVHPNTPDVTLAHITTKALSEELAKRGE